MRVGKWGIILVFFFLLVLSPGFSADRIDGNFVLGLNLAWFDGDYGHDLGLAHPEGWKPSFTKEKCRKYFQQISAMGCRVVRIWAFERQEGLIFCSNDRFVQSLDPVFLKNCDSLMDIAQENRLFVYWSLLNHLIVDDEGGKHMNIITDPKVRAHYIRNAVVPFLKRYSKHPAFWAVDLLNEAEGDIGKFDALSGCYDPRKGTSWKKMREFLKANVKAIRNAVPGIKISATSGWHEHKNLKRFTGLGLDFLDWHSYRDMADIPHRSKLKIKDIPIIIGECGPKTKKKNDTLQSKNWQAYLYNAYRKGYAGVLPWSYGTPGGKDNFSVINKDGSWRPAAHTLVRFSRQIGEIGPTFPSKRNQTLLQAIEASMKEFFRVGPGRDSNSSWSKLYFYLQKGYPYSNPDFALKRLDFCCSALYSSFRALLRQKKTNIASLKHLSIIAQRILDRIKRSNDPGRGEILNRPSVKVFLTSIAMFRTTGALPGVQIQTTPTATAKPVSGITGNPFFDN